MIDHVENKFPFLNAFENMMKAGEPLSVAFLGGSITWGACASDQGRTSYRALVSAYLEKTYPDAHLKFIDAAIGGTPSKLGVFRIDRDVIPYKPDLTFIEFAVNDGDAADSLETMEGIIRKLTKSNPEMAIFIIIVGAGKHEKYTSHQHQKHIDLANYYNLPYADVCGPVKKGIADGTINTEDILDDGCHPNDTGYKLYADIINESFANALTAEGEAATFPGPMTANRYEPAKMLELAKLADLGDWEQGTVSTQGTWFDHQPSRWLSSVIVPIKDGAVLEFDLECSGIGLYYEIFKDGGEILIRENDWEIFKTSSSMDFHYNRVAWKFELLGENTQRHLKLIAPRKNVKVAYIFYTK